MNLNLRSASNANPCCLCVKVLAWGNCGGSSQGQQPSSLIYLAPSISQLILDEGVKTEEQRSKLHETLAALAKNGACTRTLCYYHLGMG